MEGIAELLIENESEARKRLRTSARVTEQMVRNVILNLRDAGIPYLVAPYEADAQLAFLARNEIIDFVVSEDSDLIVYGVREILFKLKRSPVAAVLFSANIMDRKYQDPDFLRKVAVLSGCDYLANLTGIGLQSAIRFMEVIKSSPKYCQQSFPSFLKRLPVTLNKRSIRITDHYCQQFAAAEFCFQHQLVFCPKQRQFVPLTQHPEQTDACTRTSQQTQSQSSPAACCTEPDDDDIVIIPSPDEAGSREEKQSLPQTQTKSSSSACLLPSSPPLTQSLDASSNYCCLHHHKLSLCGRRLASPEQERQHALGRISSRSMQAYEGDDWEPNERSFKWLTKQHVRQAGLSLMNRPKDRPNTSTLLVSSKQNDDLHADLDIMQLLQLLHQQNGKQEKGATGTLPSVSIDAGKEDRNEMPAKNSLQGQECSSSRTTTPPNPAAAAEVEAACHESGLERPTPATQSLVSHAATAVHPNSASKGAAVIETTPTLRQKRAMSFPHKAADEWQDLLNSVPASATGSNKKKRKDSIDSEDEKEDMRRRIESWCETSSYFSSDGIKKQRSGTRRSPSASSASRRLPTVPLSCQPALTPVRMTTTRNPSAGRRSSSLPPVVVITRGSQARTGGAEERRAHPATQTTASRASSCVIREERERSRSSSGRKSEIANNNKKRLHTGCMGSEGMKLEPPVIRQSPYFDASPQTRCKPPSQSSRSCPLPIRLPIRRLALHDHTNIRGMPAAKFIERRNKRLFRTSPSTPSAHATQVVHRLPIVRLQEDEDEADGQDVGDDDETAAGRGSSGKTPPPLRSLMPHHHPRSGNSSIASTSASSLQRLPERRTTTTTQISGDSGYSSSSA